METVEQGENGNVIREIMINPQNVDNKYGGAGIVAMLHFSEDGKKVQLRYYSTVKEAYYKTVNQYEFDLNVIESTTPAQEPKITTSGITFNVNLSGNVAGKLIAALYDENNNFISCKTYNAQATVPVSFDSYSAGAKLKIFWWNGETITPITLPQKIEVSLQQ